LDDGEWNSVSFHVTNSSFFMSWLNYHDVEVSSFECYSRSWNVKFFFQYFYPNLHRR